MQNRLNSLTEREKEALRLLLVGHDAKSIAVRLRLSVHTINERLRDARRKLSVTSSREAARLLAKNEQTGRHSLGDKDLGVAAEASDAPSSPRERPAYSAHRLAWLSGGMLIMSLIIAAAIYASVNKSSGAPVVQDPQTAQMSNDPHPAGLNAARDWVELLDQHRWSDSWDNAAALFQAGISKSQWASLAETVRQPLGSVTTRSFKSARDATSLPGAPIGQYEILQFQTDFAEKHQAIETVVMAQAATGWKTAGYFIK